MLCPTSQQSQRLCDIIKGLWADYCYNFCMMCWRCQHEMLQAHSKSLNTLVELYHITLMCPD